MRGCRQFWRYSCWRRSKDSWCYVVICILYGISLYVGHYRPCPCNRTRTARGIVLIVSCEHIWCFIWVTVWARPRNLRRRSTRILLHKWHRRGFWWVWDGRSKRRNLRAERWVRFSYVRTPRVLRKLGLMCRLITCWGVFGHCWLKRMDICHWSHCGRCQRRRYPWRLYGRLNFTRFSKRSLCVVLQETHRDRRESMEVRVDCSAGCDDNKLAFM